MEKPYTIFINSIQTESMIDWSFAEEDADLYFKINSMGGSLPVAMHVLQRMLREKRHVITENFGNAQSAGFTIFSGGDERISSADAIFLFHVGQSSGASTNAMEKLREIAGISYSIMCKRMARISNKSYKYWMDIIQSGRDEYFHGKELKKMGVVTKLL